MITQALTRAGALAIIGGSTLAAFPGSYALPRPGSGLSAESLDRTPSETLPSGFLPPLHATARLRLPDGSLHRLELWRDGERFRRESDGGALIVVGATREDGERQITLIDGGHGRAMTVSRTNLLRIGQAVDWDELSTFAHRQPGARALLGTRPVLHAAAGECRWYRVEVKGGETPEVCWSDRWSLALQVDVGPARLEVTQVEAGRPDPSLFVVPRGFALLDVDQEIRPDGD